MRPEVTEQRRSMSLKITKFSGSHLCIHFRRDVLNIFTLHQIFLGHTEHQTASEPNKQYDTIQYDTIQYDVIPYHPILSYKSRDGGLQKTNKHP